MSERIVVYAIDLMDRSKASAAGEAGLDVSFVRSAAAGRAGRRRGRHRRGGSRPPRRHRRAIRAVRDSASVSVVALGAHVDTDRLQDARDAGAATVLA